MVQRSPDQEAALSASVIRAKLSTRFAAIAAVSIFLFLTCPGAAMAEVDSPVPTIGSGYAWGGNGHGELAAGSTSDLTFPVAVSLPVGTGSVALGRDHALAIVGGNVLAWGKGSSGQLGDGTMTSSLTPVRVLLPAGASIVAVSGDEGHSMALSSDGDVFAWGRNSAGQLGDGSTVARSTPVEVTIPGNPVIAAIATGRDHSLAVSADGRLFSWGRGDLGQLGDGLTAARPTPAEITLPAGVQVAKVAAGIGHSVALTTDGRILTWGTTAAATSGLLTPTLMPSISNAVDVVAGDHHGLALLADGTVVGWGANSMGQLGSGSTTDSEIPVALKLPTGATVKSISAAGDHGIALTTDGHRALTWGDNSSGQLGNGGAAVGTTPTFVSLAAGETLLSVSAGWFGDLVVAQQEALQRLVLKPQMVATSIGSAHQYTVRGYDRYGHDLGSLTTGITLTMTGGSCAFLVCTPSAAGLQSVTATGAGVSATASMQVLAPSPPPESSSTSQPPPATQLGPPDPTLSNTGLPPMVQTMGWVGAALVLLGSAVLFLTCLNAGRQP